MEDLRRPNQEKNDSLAFAVGGATLLALALSRRSALGALLGTVGAYLLYRGAVGRDALSQPRRSGEDRQPRDEQRSGETQRDIVDEASWESFPASDPPAH